MKYSLKFAIIIKGGNMKPINELLTEEELYVYLHYREMTQKEMAENLGVSKSSIPKYRANGKRKIREAKQRDINNAWNSQEVTLTLERKEIYLIQHALKYYGRFLNPTIGELRRNEIDPEMELMPALNHKLDAAINIKEHPVYIDFDAYWNPNIDIEQIES